MIGGPVTLTPCQVVGQVAASRIRTRAAVCGKPKPTRQVARTATRSEVKNTDLSDVTSASRRTTVVIRPADIPQIVPTGASGLVSRGTPKMTLLVGWDGSAPSRGFPEPVASFRLASTKAVVGLATKLVISAPTFPASI